MVEQTLTEVNFESLFVKLETMVSNKIFDHIFLKNCLDHYDKPYQQKNLITGKVVLEVRKNPRVAGIDLYIDNDYTIVKMTFGTKITINNDNEIQILCHDGGGSYLFSEI